MDIGDTEKYKGGPEFGLPEGTKWAVRCISSYGTTCHNKLLPISQESYELQMSRWNSRWECPVCRGLASWSDEVYEAYIEWIESYELSARFGEEEEDE